LKKSSFVLAAVALLFAGAAPGAPPPRPATLMTATATAVPASIAPGASFTLRIDATLSTGWHVNAHRPSEDYLIPTEVKIVPVEDHLLEFTYPAPQSIKFAFADKPLAVYTEIRRFRERTAAAAASGTRGFAARSVPALQRRAMPRSREGSLHGESRSPAPGNHGNDGPRRRTAPPASGTEDFRRPLTRRGWVAASDPSSWADSP
jgi:hypothetical protein